MQTWPRVSTEKCRRARSNFAFFFRDEKYLLSKESMYDFSPTETSGGASSTDWIRRFLLRRLSLQHVNQDEFNDRRTAKGPLHRADTSASVRGESILVSAL